VDGLARRTIDLFWPVIAERAGLDPSREPTFLTLETAQYHLDQALEPVLQSGAFGDVTVRRGRLLSQILDNLNKAALVGFSYHDIGQRLTLAWGGPTSRARVYEAVQSTADAFREHCLQNNLLDFSLQVELFIQHIWPQPECQAYLTRRYRHLIADNVEEDIPVAHDMLLQWVQHASSALLIYDEDGGFRTYLGADPQGARALASACEQRSTLSSSFVSSPQVQLLAESLDRHLGDAQGAPEPVPVTDEQLNEVFSPLEARFHTDLLEHVVQETLHLTMTEGVPPNQIAILAPFVGDALRFALMTEFERKGMIARSHRPSRALREEPAVRCLLTLAQIVHPQWKMCPSRQDVAQALTQAIDGLDWVRARYLTDIVYHVQDGRPRLGSFEQLRPAAQERITFAAGTRYARLRRWSEEFMAETPLPLDHALCRLFDEVLARPGYGFHKNYDASGAAANLIESVRKFRRALDVGDQDELGVRYVRMVDGGVVAAQYLRTSSSDMADAVFIAPAYSFLSENRPVAYQFWLNANSPWWGRRLYQPLTHPFVLRRGWPPERTWTEEDEFRAGQAMLRRVVLGLLRRCRQRVYLCISELNPRGREERGPLQAWAQQLLREAHRFREADDV
jgi:hypothetical protein